MNDRRSVSVWQDVHMDQEERLGVREIDSVEELRALADPLRLAILSALDTAAPDEALAVMSVKELAHQLGEPQTKLYRHVKQLEAAGLIEVAATRVVSGIVEQRYRARQRELRLSGTLYKNSPDETQAAVRSAFDLFLNGFTDQGRREAWPEDGPGKPVLLITRDRVNAQSADRIRALLEDVAREIGRAEAGDVPVSIAIGFYRLPS
jgi:DNA-binding transcriptional ArsR family regulator